MFTTVRGVIGSAAKLCYAYCVGTGEPKAGGSRTPPTPAQSHPNCCRRPSAVSWTAIRLSGHARRATRLRTLTVSRMAKSSPEAKPALPQLRRSRSRCDRGTPRTVASEPRGPKPHAAVSPFPHTAGRPGQRGGPEFMAWSGAQKVPSRRDESRLTAVGISKPYGHGERTGACQHITAAITSPHDRRTDPSSSLKPVSPHHCERRTRQ